MEHEPGSGGASGGSGLRAVGTPALMSGSGPVRREALANGMSVLVRENPSAPVVALTLLVSVGARHETVETNGVTALLGRVLLKGTRMRSALELAQAAEHAGGAVESGADQEYAEIRASGLARQWRTLLELVHEVATAPRLADEEIERERGALLAQIRGFEDQPFRVANRLLSRALYGAHACGLPTSGSLASVHALTRDDLVRHFAAFFHPDRMALAVSGRVDAGDVPAEVARWFGADAPGPPPPPLVAPPARPARARDGEARPTQQTQVLLGFLAPPIGHPDHVALKVMNAILGGGMSSRLFRTLRDEEGLAYAVGSFYPTRREASRIVVHIGTAPSSRPAAEAGLRREVERLRADGVPDEELRRAKAFLSGSFALDLRTNARQSFYLAFFELMGVGADYVRLYPELVDAVTGADVARVARRYLVHPSMVVVGPDQRTDAAPLGARHP